MKDEIQDFAKEIQEKFNQNQEEKGESWQDVSIEYLEGKLIEETKEYLESGNKDELPDIGNICWMLYTKKEDR